MVEDRIKLFGMSHQLVERALDKVESEREINLGRDLYSEEHRDQTYYPQMSEAIRAEAARMREHYEIFYSLEKSIRALISERLQTEHGASWWTAVVPEFVRTNVEKNIGRELESGISRRSEEEIDYTTFGELGEIVGANWNSFSDTFSNLKGFRRVMASLNLLRGPIAHCSPLAADEVVRLQLTLRDWFRLME